MKKILFIAHSGKISGGANRSLLSLMISLKNDGYVPSLLVPQDGDDMKKVCAEQGIAVYTAPYRSCCAVFQHNPKDILRLGKILIEPAVQYMRAKRLSRSLPQDFDLFYTNDRMAAIGAFIAKERKKPHIWHIRAFAKENKSTYPFYWYRLIDRYSDRVVLISSALLSSFERFVSKSKLVRIYNGLDFDALPSFPHRAHEGYRFLLCGRIVPSKGQDDAIHALDILNRSGMDCELYLAGETPSYDDNSYYQGLLRVIEEKQLKDKVHFLGHVEDMPSLRRDMDAELVCSWFEPFGRVTIEAMHAGLPVIGTNAGGTPEIIEDRKTGFLYSAGNAKELAEKLEWLIRHPEEADQMGKAGKERAHSLFPMDKTANSVKQLITQVLSERAWG